MRITIARRAGTSLGLGEGRHVGHPITGHDRSRLSWRAPKGGGHRRQPGTWSPPVRGGPRRVGLDLARSSLPLRRTGDRAMGPVLTRRDKAPVMEMARAGSRVSFIGGTSSRRRSRWAGPSLGPSRAARRSSWWCRPARRRRRGRYLCRRGAEPRCAEHDGVIPPPLSYPGDGAGRSGRPGRSEGRHDREDLAGGELAALGAALLGERADIRGAARPRELLLPWSTTRWPSSATARPPGRGRRGLGTMPPANWPQVAPAPGEPEGDEQAGDGRGF